MEWEYERRLVFVVSERWTGWFCERCCWSRPQPVSELKRNVLAMRIESEFAAHDCEDFAKEQWNK